MIAKIEIYLELNHLNKIPSSDKMRSDIYSHVSKIIKNFDILILADFNYGLIDEKLISKLLVLARNIMSLWLPTPKHHLSLEI